MIEIRLPKPGPEIENATITKWECKEGDKIQIGDILAIIKTPIGSFKVAAEEQGILEDIIQTAGSSIDFDEPIAIMRPDLTISDFPNLSGEEEDETMPLPIEAPEAPEENIDANEDDGVVEEVTEAPLPIELPEEGIEPLEVKEPTPELTESESIEPLTQEWSEEESVETTPPEETESPDLAETIEQGTGTTEMDSVEIPESDTEDLLKIAEPEQVEVSPAARKMAEREGIDLATVTGTGDNGKILYIDIENAIKDRDETSQSEEEVEEGIDEPVTSEPEYFEESQAQSPEPEENTISEQDFEQTFQPTEQQDQSDSDLPLASDETATLIPSLDENPWSDHPEESAETPVGDPDEPTYQLSEEENKDNSQFPQDGNVEAFEPEDSGQVFETLSEPEPSWPETDPHFEPETEPEPEPVIEEAIDSTEDFGMEEPPEDLPFPDFAEISTQFHLSKKDDLIIPFNSNKKAFAESQLDSNRNVPHCYLVSDIDITDTEQWLAENNHKQNSRITLTDLFIKAVGQALAMMPEMNAFVRADRMILKRSINIGLTTAVDEGVVTPVIPDVYHKSLHKVAETVRKNVDLAVKTKVILDYDTTFTIHQLQEPGIKRMVPLITAPQTGSLALGTAQKQVVPMNDFIAIRNIVEATLACDSRAIDAANAAKFLQSVKESIESLKPGKEDPDWIEGNEQLRLI